MKLKDLDYEYTEDKQLVEGKTYWFEEIFYVNYRIYYNLYQIIIDKRIGADEIAYHCSKVEQDENGDIKYSESEAIISKVFKDNNNYDYFEFMTKNAFYNCRRKVSIKLLCETIK